MSEMKFHRTRVLLIKKLTQSLTKANITYKMTTRLEYGNSSGLGVTCYILFCLSVTGIENFQVKLYPSLKANVLYVHMYLLEELQT